MDGIYIKNEEHLENLIIRILREFESECVCLFSTEIQRLSAKDIVELVRNYDKKGGQ